MATLNLGQVVGPPGIKGDTGSQGIQGIKGDTGQQGIQGLKGDIGPKGDTGETGLRGLQGLTGTQGIQGVKGDPGSQGIQGVPGIQGTKGDDGLTTSVNGVSQVGGAISLTQDNIPDGTTKKGYTATEKTKLAGIATSANNYTHPTTAGNKHIPTGGASNQVLKYSASGTATWQNESVTPIANNLTETVAGKALDATQGKILAEQISTHLENANNPHAVTIAQTGGSNKNLLHNWDFRNPVNQRGTSSYANKAYTIDRWLWTFAATTRTITLNSGYITIANTSATTGIFAEKLETLPADTYTLSVQYSDGTVESKNLTWDGSTLTELPTSFGTLSLRLIDGFPTFCFGVSTGKTINVKCAKLERGTVSTLINDQPADFGEQLALCQRFAIELNPYGGAFTTVGLGVTSTTANTVTIMIPTPNTLRAIPTTAYIIGNWTIKATNNYALSTITPVAVTVGAIKATVITTTSASGNLYAELYINNDATARIFLSADL